MSRSTKKRKRPAPTRAVPPSRKDYWPWLAMVGGTFVMVIALVIMGRRWWCECGQPFLWSGNVWTPHNSQHLFDPYSFTHVLHGVLWCGALAWCLPRLTPLWQLVGATAISALWEVIENTDLVIQRFREATVSLDYHGDTMANALGDVASCGIGFALARRLGLWGSLILFVVTEVILLFWIKDNLTLNVLMLLYPVKAIKTWQVGG